MTVKCGLAQNADGKLFAVVEYKGTQEREALPAGFTGWTQDRQLKHLDQALARMVAKVDGLPPPVEREPNRRERRAGTVIALKDRRAKPAAAAAKEADHGKPGTGGDEPL